MKNLNFFYESCALTNWAIPPLNSYWFIILLKIVSIKIFAGGGSDGTRTRDLLRDRTECCWFVLDLCSITFSIQSTKSELIKRFCIIPYRRICVNLIVLNVLTLCSTPTSQIESKRNRVDSVISVIQTPMTPSTLNRYAQLPPVASLRVFFQ